MKLLNRMPFVIKFNSMILALLLWLSNASAQTTAFTASDIALMKGKWTGTLTYLDYSSNKPYTMPANVDIHYLPKTKTLLYHNSYPKEPKANNVDTIVLSKKGTMIGKEQVQKRTVLADGNIEIVTEYASVDGNDNKSALIRHTYTLGKNIFQIKKEVQYTGQTEWIRRNESSYSKAR
jgi:hypothetical protein